MNKEQFTLIGELTEVKITENPNPGKWTKRASLTVEHGGNKNYIATFDENSIEVAHRLEGGTVKVVYTVNGKYKNLVDGMIENCTKIPEETIPVHNTQQTTIPQKQAETSTYGEFQKKQREEQKAENERKQRLIVRQNSWTQAFSYMDVCLKALEQGVLSKEELTNESFNLDQIMEKAHEIEKDILRD